MRRHCGALVEKSDSPGFFKKNQRRKENRMERMAAENIEHDNKIEGPLRIDWENSTEPSISIHPLKDLREQGKRWVARYNKTPRSVLDLKSLNEIEIEKLEKLMRETGEVRCLKLLKCFTSFDD